jgi:hypothetical protein
MMPSIADMKARYSIAEAWRDLDLDGEPAKNCRSPFPKDHKHGDAHPSFSVFADGTRWFCYSTGEGGDVFDLVRKARSTDITGAVDWVRERLGIKREPAAIKGLARFPELRPGTRRECAALAELRGISVEAVHLAATRGFLHFGTLWQLRFWAVTDRRRKLVEFRRLNGSPWPAFGHLAERKAHCIGSGKDWPIGTLEASPFATVAWLEGAGDFLAFWHFALIEGRAESVAPVAMLGAANHRVASDALAYFKGKCVVLYPHCDDAGRTAAKAWARQLRDVGAVVSAFDLSGLTKDDDSPGIDLNDVSRMSADCYERADCYRFREVLP